MKHATLMIQLNLQGSDSSHTIQSCVMNVCDADIGRLMYITGELRVQVQDAFNGEITVRSFKLENIKEKDCARQSDCIQDVRERVKEFVLA